MNHYATHCDTELKFFATEDLAIANALSEIIVCRSEACDGWPEDVVDGICVMQVTHRAVKVDPDADYRCVDYHLAVVDRGQCVQCGGPMSLNPHPQAGKVPSMLNVGAVAECIPCLVNSRRSWCKRALEAEHQVAQLNEFIDKLPSVK